MLAFFPWSALDAVALVAALPFAGWLLRSRDADVGIFLLAVGAVLAALLVYPAALFLPAAAFYAWALVPRRRRAGART